MFKVNFGKGIIKGIICLRQDEMEFYSANVDKFIIDLRTGCKCGYSAEFTSPGGTMGWVHFD